MKIVVAPDSFKGSLSAAEICDAMKTGILRIFPDTEVVKIPMADGGEGTVAALVAATGGRLEQVTVVGPLGETIKAEYGILGDRRTAIIEMAAASGLPLVPADQRNPLKTTTFGTGQLMLAALEKGCKKLIIGIGGSATTDCGAGMAQALGARFLRVDGTTIGQPMCGDLLAEVEKIDLTGLHPGISTCQVTAACDVDNPLLGPHGAVMVYSRQKGANDQQLELLEKNMAHAIDVIEETLRRNIRTIPGTGAAGGLGAGLIAFAGATLQPGVELVLEASGFRQKIQGARLILTGEGRIDFQTAFGKTISGVVKEAARQGVPVIAVAGSVQDAAENLYPSGVSSLFSICQGPMTLEQAMKDTPHLMAKTVERILRAMQAGGFGQA